ncbi:MAG: EamA family transporter [Clostridia bacterium]|nr:EamA family transporter [Clostridia bacterium]
MWNEFMIIAVLFFSLGNMFARMVRETDERYGVLKMIAALGAGAGVHAIFMLALGTRFFFGDLLRYLPTALFYAVCAAIMMFGGRYVRSDLFGYSALSGAPVLILCLISGNTAGSGGSLLIHMAAAVLLIGASAISFLPEAKKIASLSGNADKKERALSITIPVVFCIAASLGRFFDGFMIVRRGRYGNALSGYLDEASALVAFDILIFTAGAAAIVYLAALKRERIFTKEKTPALAAVGVCGTLGRFAYFYMIGGEAARAVPVISCCGIFALIFRMIFLKKKPTPLDTAALILASAGIILTFAG